VQKRNLVALAVGATVLASVAIACNSDDSPPDTATPSDSTTPSAGPTESAPPTATEAGEQAEPTFIGDVLGIWITPKGLEEPEIYVSSSDLCALTGPEEVPFEQAGYLDLEVQLPGEYVLREEDFNTAAVKCGASVIVARRVYLGQSAQVPPGGASVLIGRAGFKVYEDSVTVDRVRTTEIGGRAAILIVPDVNSYTSPAAKVLFPESWGYTWMETDRLPLDTILEIAELVAAAASAKPQ
jgi:hypothetical protein